MTDAINIGGTNVGTTAVTPISAAVAASAPVVAATVATGTESSAQTTRFVSNPLARVLVTQSYDSHGNVVAQVPSATVLAYLENGLSPDGSPLHSTSA